MESEDILQDVIRDLLKDVVIEEIACDQIQNEIVQEQVDLLVCDLS